MTLPHQPQFQSVISGRMVSLEKFPGEILMGIGEVLRHLLAKLILFAGGDWEKDVYRSVKLCAGPEAGIEGGGLHGL